MALLSGKSILRSVVRWSYSKTNTGFNPTTQSGELGLDSLPAAGTYNHVLAATYTIAAAGTQAVDFYGPWTAVSGESVTGTKILGFLIKVTGSTGILKVAPHGTNPLNWPFAGTSPYVLLTPSTRGAQWLHCDGTHATVSSTTKQWLLTNTGSATITVKLAAFVGT